MKLIIFGIIPIAKLSLSQSLMSIDSPAFWKSPPRLLELLRCSLKYSIGILPLQKSRKTIIFKRVVKYFKLKFL